MPTITGRRAVRRVVFDTNSWKSFVHAQLAVSMGDPGSVSLFGRTPATHRLLADHMLAEDRVRTEGRGRTVDEWKLRVESLDNHWFDCAVGASVAASMERAVLFRTGESMAAARPRVKLSTLRWAR